MIVARRGKISYLKYVIFWKKYLFQFYNKIYIKLDDSIIRSSVNCIYCSIFLFNYKVIYQKIKFNFFIILYYIRYMNFRLPCTTISHYYKKKGINTF